jgi:hypothetical protein
LCQREWAVYFEVKSALTGRFFLKISGKILWSIPHAKMKEGGLVIFRGGVFELMSHLKSFIALLKLNRAFSLSGSISSAFEK